MLAVFLELKPVRNVLTSSSDQRFASSEGDVVLNQFGQVVDSVEERDPAVVSRAVLGNFLRGVVLSDLVRLW